MHAHTYMHSVTKIFSLPLPLSHRVLARQLWLVEVVRVLAVRGAQPGFEAQRRSGAHQHGHRARATGRARRTLGVHLMGGMQ